VQTVDLRIWLTLWARGEDSHRHAAKLYCSSAVWAHNSVFLGVTAARVVETPRAMGAHLKHKSIVWSR
jgi:hypothetical protein